jgi:4-aminobutyrate aminotransferase-like enzyme
VLATLDIFEGQDILGAARRSSAIIEEGLVALKSIPFVKNVRGEEGGMVWGVEVGDFGGKTANEVANACVLAAYRGDDKGRAVHLMGPLAKKVLRISPPLTITADEAKDSMDCLTRCFRTVERGQ